MKTQKSLVSVFIVLVCFFCQMVFGAAICVPWQPSNPSIAHYTYNGREVTLKGIARGADIVEYRWDFGDGGGTGWASISDPYDLGVKHTYNGTVGQLYIAKLYVRNSSGTEYTDEYPVRIYDSSDLSIDSHLDVRINIAVDEALWYLHTNMNRGNYNAGTPGYGQPYGSWSVGGSDGRDFASVGAAVDAFQLHGSKVNMDTNSDPYVETVQRGLNYLLFNSYAYTITNQTHGNPDTNGNGIGIVTNRSSYIRDSRQTYIGGLSMVTLASSGAPNRIAELGRTNIYGRTYAEIVQDMVDFFAWGQTDSGYRRGGWRYYRNSGDGDMSATQWPILGMQAAKENMGSTIPAFVRNELAFFLEYTQYKHKNNYHGGFGYQYNSQYINAAKTAAGIICHYFAGTPVTDPKIQSAMGYLYRHWNDSGGGWTDQALLGNSYGMYAVMKAMRIPEPDILKIKEYDYTNEIQTGNEFDWYYETSSEPREGLAHYLVRGQQADGSWDDNRGHSHARVYDALATGWRTLVLLKGVSIIPPEAVVSNVGSLEYDLNQDIPLDGSDSFHPDLNRQIVSHEWDFDYDGTTFDVDATGQQVVIAGGFPATGFYPVALRVTDDNPENQGGPQSSMTVFEIHVHPPCHDPHARIGGPYQGYVGTAVTLDATDSYDPDSQNLTYEWDLDNDGLYGSEDTDCFGEPSDAVGATVQWTWHSPYSGGIGLKVSDDGCYTTSEFYTGFDVVHTTVEIGNHAPVSSPGGPYHAYPGSTITLDGSNSYDSDPEDSITYAWDLDNDGQFDDSTDAKPSFTVGSNVDEVYDICLKVTDQFGKYDIACTTVITTVVKIMSEMSAGRIDYDRRNGQFCVEVTAKNITGQSIEGPIWLVMENISYASITLVNPDGTTEDEKEYIDMSDQLTNNILASDQTVSKRICFSNPDRLRFNFTVSLYSMADLEPDGMQPRSEETTIGYVPAGDITGEGNVDAADLAIMANDWLTDRSDADADIFPEYPDGKVNLEDLAELAKDWMIQGDN